MKPIRTALFAPGIKDKVMGKALESGADAVILDLEDSVPLASKAEARTLVAKVIDGVAAAAKAGGPQIYVRVNGAQTGLLADDLAAIVRPGLNAILLPKVESVEEVQSTAAAMAQHEKSHRMKDGSAEIILQIESALGVHRCYDLIKASPRVGGTCIGVAQDGDLQTDLGCSWSIEGTELLYARSKVLLETRAAGPDICPIDGVFSLRYGRGSDYTSGDPGKRDCPAGGADNCMPSPTWPPSAQLWWWWTCKTTSVIRWGGLVKRASTCVP